MRDNLGYLFYTIELGALVSEVSRFDTKGLTKLFSWIEGLRVRVPSLASSLYMSLLVSGVPLSSRTTVRLG